MPTFRPDRTGGLNSSRSPREKSRGLFSCHAEPSNKCVHHIYIYLCSLYYVYIGRPGTGAEEVDEMMSEVKQLEAKYMEAERHLAIAKSESWEELLLPGIDMSQQDLIEMCQRETLALANQISAIEIAAEKSR